MSAHKQRLKAWCAQLLLTHDAPLQTRDVLLSWMQKSVSAPSAFAVENCPPPLVGHAQQNINRAHGAWRQW